MPGLHSDGGESTANNESGDIAMVNVDFSIRCYGCDKLLRTVAGVDIEDIFDDEDGEDICEECYNKLGVEADAPLCSEG